MSNLNTQSVSLVVPVYRGAPYLHKLHAEVGRLRAALHDAGAPIAIAELIFVNDDAQDDSPQILRELAAQSDWVRVLHMSRNYGQHPATVAGILHSAGDWVCTLDEDMQHQPSDITLLLLEATQSEQDVCYAKSRTPSHAMWRNLSSRLTKQAIAMLSGNSAIPHFNSFRVIRGPIARAAASVVAHQTYFDVALSWFTKRVCFRELDLHDERQKQEKRSSYNLRSLARHARQLFQSSEIKLLQLSSLGGLGLMMIAGVVGLYAVAVRLFAPEIIDLPGWTSVFVSTVFFGGASAFLLGLTLDQVYFVAQHMRGRPVFFAVDREADADVARWLAEHPNFQ